MKDYNDSKRSDQPVILTILGRFCNKRCTVHYIINVISKAGADVVRTITSINSNTTAVFTFQITRNIQAVFLASRRSLNS